MKSAVARLLPQDHEDSQWVVGVGCCTCLPLRARLGVCFEGVPMRVCVRFRGFVGFGVHIETGVRGPGVLGKSAGS